MCWLFGIKSLETRYIVKLHKALHGIEWAEQWHLCL